MTINDGWIWPHGRSAQYRYIVSLRPTREQRQANKSALGRVVYVCHNNANIPVGKVVTCGSVGKWTNSTFSADLDLVVYVNGLNPANMVHRHQAIMENIQIAMDAQYPGTRDSSLPRKFGLKYNIAGMDIDILIGASDIHPLDFLVVTDHETRAYMSASVSHINKRFMQNQGALFKDLVRVAKDWRDSFNWPPQCKPKSYLIEVIMLEACRHVKGIWSDQKQGVTYEYRPWLAEKVLLKFFELIASVEGHNHNQYNSHNLPTLFICFQKYYKYVNLPMNEPEPLFESRREVRRGNRTEIKVRRATAIVMDPVNPTNNLWLTLADATVFVDRASRTIDMMID